MVSPTAHSRQTAEGYIDVQPAVAFLSNRKLHVRRNGVTRLLESEFERTVRERTASIERRHAWKTQGRGAMFTSGLWAGQAQANNDVPVLLTGLTARQSGTLVYSLETDAVSGVFLLDAEGVESAPFHTADFRIRHAALDPEERRWRQPRSTRTTRARISRCFRCMGMIFRS